MRASTALAVLSAVVASAQSAQNFTSELDMTIDTNKVKMETRAIWCRAQTNTCGLLCDNNTDKNSCAQDTLKFECTCASNKSMPGLQFYTQTVPTFICEERFKECTNENANKADEQEGCKKNIQALCGKSDPPKRTSGPVSSSTSGGLAAPTMAPAGNGAAVAAALGFLAYLL
ncbi:uncharacterized protein HRG_11601 [Hirsutella rhossiliensis]|uniref:DUF7707 domain-containing protein n=1 Tax=Hirsutella rhossiliensis TaxID=111463 RepID=A0A9P8SD10_9HYPO|nr:uncharacterized protein HRG_11601 [Hirsutella rhossiliensis]KAH0957454.1 hypothetical protein HRG_11601 [Hirsutella rhossiliensis]